MNYLYHLKNIILPIKVPIDAVLVDRSSTIALEAKKQEAGPRWDSAKPIPT